MARLADRLAPGAPADYTVAAPGRWGGPLTGPGVHARRAEEQALVLAAAGGASVPLLRQGVPGGEALAVAPAAYHNPPSLAPILAAAQPEGAADEVAQPEAAGWQPSEADAPAAEAIRRVLRVALGFRARDNTPAHAPATPAAGASQAAAARARFRAGCGERCARRGACRAGLCGGAAWGHVCAAAGARGAAERAVRPGAAGQHLDAGPAQQRAARNNQRLVGINAESR